MMVTDSLSQMYKLAVLHIFFFSACDTYLSRRTNVPGNVDVESMLVQCWASIVIGRTAIMDYTRCVDMLKEDMCIYLSNNDT